MKPMLRHAPLLAVLALGLAACGSEKTPSPQGPAPALETRVVETTMQPTERDWDGVVEAIDRATLAAQTGGRIADLAMDVGDEVAEGQVLARFTAIEQQSGQRRASAALEAARASAAEAKAAFERAAVLRPEGAISQSTYDQARAAHEAAQAQLAAAHAALREADAQVGYTEIRAPYRAVVAARLAQPGETVAPGSALLSLLSLQRLRLLVEVPQSQAEELAQAQAFVLTGDGRRLPVAAIVPFPQADAATHSVTLRLDLPPDASPLRPGMTAKAVFQLGQAPRLTVPDSALSRRGEVVAVHVLDAQGFPALRQVRIGQDYDGETQVLAGLLPGETIALDAQAALDARRRAAAGH